MDENEVIGAVCAYLQADGYAIEQSLRTTEQGVDIVARHRTSGRLMYIEARGGICCASGECRCVYDHATSAITIQIQVIES